MAFERICKQQMSTIVCDGHKTTMRAKLQRTSRAQPATTAQPTTEPDFLVETTVVCSIRQNATQQPRRTYRRCIYLRVFNDQQPEHEFADWKRSNVFRNSGYQFNMPAHEFPELCNVVSHLCGRSEKYLTWSACEQGSNDFAGKCNP